MNKELRILENYISNYAEAKNEYERKLMFTYFEDKKIMDIVKLLQERKQLKNLNQMQLFYLDEVLIVTKYYKELQQLISDYKMDTSYERDTEHLTNRYNDIYRTHDTVELFLAYKMLNSSEKVLIGDIARKEPLPRKYTLAKRMANILEVFKNNASIDDIEVLANHYYLTYNVFAQAMEAYERKCSDDDKKVLNDLSRKMYVKMNDKIGKMVIEIINTTDINELIKEYISKGITLIDIRKLVNNSRNSKLLSLTNSDRVKLATFLTEFSNYKKEETKKEEDNKQLNKEKETKIVTRQVTLEEARQEIKKFEMSGYTTKVGYCTNNNIDLEYFDKCKSLVDATKVKKGKKRPTEFTSIAHEIADKIRNGIEENGEIRDFDMIDFYVLTNSSIADVQNKLAYLPPTKDNTLIKKFLGQKVIFHKIY